MLSSPYFTLFSLMPLNKNLMKQRKGTQEGSLSLNDKLQNSAADCFPEQRVIILILLVQD